MINSCCRVYNVIFLGLISLIANGCTTVDPKDLEPGKSKYHFGVVKVSSAETDPKISATRVRTVGAHVSNGFMIGLRDSEHVLVPLKENQNEGTPMEATCGIVIIIRSKTEAEHIKEILGDFEGDNVCTVKF